MQYGFLFWYKHECQETFMAPTDLSNGQLYTQIVDVILNLETPVDRLVLVGYGYENNPEWTDELLDCCQSESISALEHCKAEFAWSLSLISNRHRHEHLGTLVGHPASIAMNMIAIAKASHILSEPLSK